MDLGRRVRIKREEKGWSQEELAAKMGYSSRSSINKIENGRPCTQKIIVRLAEALDVSIAYLMGWDQEQIDAISEMQRDANAYDDMVEAKILEFSKKIEELQLSEDELDEVYSYAIFVKSRRK